MNAHLPTPESAPSAPAIFVVEDEALIAMELQDHLQTLGYRVCGHAARGETALEKIPALRPDLVLMDIHLAGSLNGIDTAAQLGGSGRGSVIFLSAYSDPALLTNAMRAEPLGYLVKPVSQRGLHAAIEVALQRRRREEELHASHSACEARLAALYKTAGANKPFPARLTVCPHCRQIRTDEADWQTVPRFIAREIGAEIAYAACPQCHAGPPPADS